MKKNKYNPEWILDNIPDSACPLNDIEFVLTTRTFNATKKIDQALDTLGIIYGNDAIEYGPENEPRVDYYEYYWNMDIEDIKEHCPNLYLKWIKWDKVQSPDV